MQRELTNLEIADLLNRNFSLAGRVAVHKALVSSGGWSQTQEAVGVFEIALFQLPIPSQGLVFTDDIYGSIVLFPDARGNLHYNANLSAAVIAAVVVPPYHSPTGNSIEQTIADINRAADRAGVLIPRIAVPLFGIGILIFVAWLLK